MFKKKIRIILLSCAMSTQISFATYTAPPSVETLIAHDKDQKLPPLVPRFDLPSDPHKPFGHEPNRLQHDYPRWFERLTSIQQDDLLYPNASPAAAMIASFEFAFPGATWAFIGRDTQIFADLFEAFYLAHGQTDRVIRVGISRPTLNDPDIISKKSKFLRYLDNNLKIFKTHGSRLYPCIFVDAISRQGGQQGKYLLSLIYEKLKAQGADLSDWVSIVNFIGLQGSTTPTTLQPTLWKNVHASLQNMQYQLKSYGAQTTFTLDQIPQPLIYADSIHPRPHTDTLEAFLYPNESSYTHWVGMWHDSFGPLHAEPNAHVIDSPGRMVSSVQQDAWMLYRRHIIQFAISPAFMDQVRIASNALDFEFNFSRILAPVLTHSVSVHELLKETIITEEEEVATPPKQKKTLAARFKGFIAKITKK